MPDCDVLVREKKFFRTVDEFNPEIDYLLFRHPSFSVQDKKITRFETHASIEEAYFKPNKIVAISRKNIEISTKIAIGKAEKGNLSILADLIEDLYIQNIYPDIVAASARKFVSLVSEKFENLGLENLLEYICSEYHQASGISLLTYNISDATSKGRRSSDFQMELVEVTDFGHALEEISDELASTIKYCSRFGRMSDGYFSSEEGVEIHYAVLPANIDHHDLDEGNLSRDFVVVFAKNDELDEFLVRFLEIGVSRLEQRDKLERQATIIAKLTSLKRELQSKIRRGILPAERSRNDFVTPRLQDVCEEIKEHVGAHSITIRTYNPFSDELELYLEACDDQAQYECLEPQDISVNNIDSVNVRCFLNNSPEEHIYIRKLGPRPSKEDSNGDRSFNPRNSSSEACFPIWKSGTPHGTLNVEAPRENALSPYIQFLKWISMLISEISTEISNALSSDVADQLSKINELAHGTLDANPVILDNLLKGRTATERKVVSAWQKYAVAYRKPSETFLRTDKQIYDLHTVISGELDRAVRAVPYFRYSGGEVYVPKAIRISSQEAQNIKGIMRALLSNAIKHAGFDEGQLRVFGLFRAKRPYLFIKYSTNDAIVQCDIVDTYGTSPVLKNNEVRYGGFLMAERVRSADGSFFVERPKPGSGKFCRLRISIAIPLDEES